MFNVSLILTIVISKSQEKKELVKLRKSELRAASNNSESANLQAVNDFVLVGECLR